MKRFFQNVLTFSAVFSCIFAYSINIERLGSRYGGWGIPVGSINASSICYLVGVGEDVTFDLSLIEKYNCHVHLFDPTPRSIKHIANLRAAFKRGETIDAKPKGTYPIVPAIEQLLHFYPLGIWNEDTTVKFFAPKIKSHVSHSILNLRETKQYFLGECQKLSTVMHRLGHAHIDLLKLDIEGAEYNVLQDIVDEDLDVRIICVEFDEVVSGKPRATKRANATIQQLKSKGYKVYMLQGYAEVLFVRADHPSIQ